MTRKNNCSIEVTIETTDLQRVRRKSDIETTPASKVPSYLLGENSNIFREGSIRNSLKHAVVKLMCQHSPHLFWRTLNQKLKNWKIEKFVTVF